MVRTPLGDSWVEKYKKRFPPWESFLLRSVLLMPQKEGQEMQEPLEP